MKTFKIYDIHNHEFIVDESFYNIENAINQAINEVDQKYRKSLVGLTLQRALEDLEDYFGLLVMEGDRFDFLINQETYLGNK